LRSPWPNIVEAVCGAPVRIISIATGVRQTPRQSNNPPPMARKSSPHLRQSELGVRARDDQVARHEDL